MSYYNRTCFINRTPGPNELIRHCFVLIVVHKINKIFIIQLFFINKSNKISKYNFHEIRLYYLVRYFCLKIKYMAFLFTKSKKWKFENWKIMFSEMGYSCKIVNIFSRFLHKFTCIFISIYFLCTLLEDDMSFIEVGCF